MSGRMTAQKAKKLSLEVWRYLAAHPEIKTKTGLPDNIFSKIEGCHQWCPLCDLFNYSDGFHIKENCDEKCPLNLPVGDCYCPKSFFQKWFTAKSDKTRKKYAQKIVAAIEAWEIEE